MIKSSIDKKSWATYNSYFINTCIQPMPRQWNSCIVSLRFSQESVIFSKGILSVNSLPAESFYWSRDTCVWIFHAAVHRNTKRDQTMKTWIAMLVGVRRHHFEFIPSHDSSILCLLRLYSTKTYREVNVSECTSAVCSNSFCACEETTVHKTLSWGFVWKSSQPNRISVRMANTWDQLFVPKISPGMKWHRTYLFLPMRWTWKGSWCAIATYMTEIYWDDHWSCLSQNCDHETVTARTMVSPRLSTICKRCVVGGCASDAISKNIRSTLLHSMLRLRYIENTNSTELACVMDTNQYVRAYSNGPKMYRQTTSVALWNDNKLMTAPWPWSCMTVALEREISRSGYRYLVGNPLSKKRSFPPQ